MLVGNLFEGALTPYSPSDFNSRRSHSGSGVLNGAYQKLRDAVDSHLTFAEGFGPLLSKVPARPVE
jgi:hypothetical protein